MIPSRRAVSIGVLMFIVLECFATNAVAQPERIRVVNDRSPILASDLITPVMYVDAGAELMMVGEQGNWIEVLLPGLNRRRETGFVAKGNIAPPRGTPVIRRGPTAADAEPPASSPQPATPPVSQPSRANAPPPGRRVATTAGLSTGLRGFGNVSLGAFTASHSFDAVLGSAPIPGHIRGPWLGAGAQYQARNGLFVEGGADFFRQTGQRVFVDGDTVYELGVPDKLTLIPVSATVGYRLKGRTAAPFVGGGIGQYLFSERTPFDDSSEHAWQHATSYHVLGGVEFRASREVGIAIQGRYTTTPDALSNGVGPALGESNLGGVQFGVKVLVR